jgi:hypothetical protein
VAKVASALRTFPREKKLQAAVRRTFRLGCPLFPARLSLSLSLSLSLALSLSLLHTHAHTTLTRVDCLLFTAACLPA